MENNIIVIYGANSVEQEISILTTLQIKQKYKGKYNLILCYLKDGLFYVSDKLTNINIYKDFNKSKAKLNKIEFKANTHYIKIKNKKVFFEAVMILGHGKNIEDGSLYAFFNTLNIDVISENLLSATIGQNKILSKLCCNSTFLPYYKIDEYSFYNNKETIVKNAYNLSFPLILKPCSLGSSVGLSLINNVDELISKVEELLNLDEQIIMEKYLNNFIELNVAILRKKDEFIISEIEKVSNSKVLSYKDKYVTDKLFLSANYKEVPANISLKLKEKIIEQTINIYTSLNASLLVRIDYLYDNDTDTLYFNEINNIPGSLALYLFNKKGISTNELIDSYIDEGLSLCEKRKKQITSYENNIFKEEFLCNVKFNK